MTNRPDHPPALAQPLDPQASYVHLAADGRATITAGGDAFWALPAAQMASFGDGWLVSEFECASDWPNWEMHPEADEFVYLLSGAVEVQLDLPGGLRRVSLTGRGAVVVPRGVWHTAKVTAPSRMLHITRGAGTESRPAN
jgi:mannose-6-phosphate isomerase-like protein (cupin superfamily)